MARKAIVTGAAALLMAGWSGAASAQAAAETATILSATGQGTGSAARSMGGNVAGSLNRASQAIQAASSGGRSSGGRGRGTHRAGYVVTGGSSDALEGTDAPTYQTGSGASIRVSGRLIQRAAPACSENCAEPPAPPNPSP